MFLAGSVDGFLASAQMRGQRFRARKSIPDCRAVGAHSLGRSDRRGGLWSRGAARYGCDPAALVRSLAERFRRRLRASRRFATSCSGKIAGAKPKLFPPRRDDALYLHSDGQSKFAQRRWRRSPACAAASDEPCDIFVYDPEVPVLAPGARRRRAGSLIRPRWNWATICWSIRPSRSLSRCGFSAPRALSLYCSTSSAHTDFTAKLVRVRPNGAAEFICIGIARSSWLFAETGYAADKVHRWEFDLEPTSCRFAAGDRIRLEIASSAFPLYDRNPGSDVPSCRATSWDWRRSTQIRLSRSRASFRAVSAGVARRANERSECARVPGNRIRGRQQALWQRACGSGSDRPDCCQGRIRQPHRPLRLRQIHVLKLISGLTVADAAGRFAWTA